MSEKSSKQYLKELYYKTDRLVVYRNILADDIVMQVRNLLKLAGFKEAASLEGEFFAICSRLVDAAARRGLRGHLFKEHLLYLLATDENAFSRSCEKYGSAGIGESLRKIAARDLEILMEFLNIDFSLIVDDIDFISNFDSGKKYIWSANKIFAAKFDLLREGFMKNSHPDELVKLLADFYKTVGCGKTGMYVAFRWEPDKGLVGIKNPDPITLKDLVGYERQKEILFKNTEAFVNGKGANNVLLYGERGTGKSSSIKALVNEFSVRGLRLVEVPKNRLSYLPEILRCIREKPRYFIIFIDDLSFEGYETEYKYLKALIEGGVEAKPDNVLIYATSNRRHLVQENWKDREEEGELNISDAVQEKLSLADRFGITITFTTPNQEEYLRIVEGLAKKHGISLPPNELRERALRWEKWYNGRSGRTAVHFINNLLGSRVI